MHSHGSKGTLWTCTLECVREADLAHISGQINWNLLGISANDAKISTPEIPLLQGGSADRLRSHGRSRVLKSVVGVWTVHVEEGLLLQVSLL